MRKIIHSTDNWPRNLYNRYTKPVTSHKENWKKYKHKKYIQDNLIIVQSYICAYCEIELSRDIDHVGFHIEHIKPKSKFPNCTFDYTNLMLSCFTTTEELYRNNFDKSSLSCGHFKGDHFNTMLFISPVEIDCATYFQYELDGRITPVDNLDRENKEKAIYTIRHLNLNCPRLTRERKDLIENTFKQIEKIGYEGDGLKKFSNLELSIKNGKSNSFITTREQFLKNFT